MESIVKLPKFKKGKYKFCLEKHCELQKELRDGDPAHLECWLCIVDHYSRWPNISNLYSLNQIIQSRNTKNFGRISNCE